MINIPEHQLKFFADYIKKELGIIYKSENYYQLEKRLVEIARNLNLDSTNELYQKASQIGISGHVKQMILDVATNNETSFFRDPRVFQAIEQEVLPSWREAHPRDNVFRIWSVACSFGQEPYSMAIMINEYKNRGKDFPRVDIRATDISERALNKAKQGKYSQLEVQRGLSAPLLIKYFKKDDDDNWQINSDIRTSVFFEKMNLLNITGMIGTFDIILCRNVLIYQNDDKKREILDILYRYLADDGFLILGAAESMIGLSDKYQQVQKGKAFFFQKKSQAQNIA